MTAEAGALASLGPATTGSIRPIYTAVNATAARAALDEMTAEWGQKYAAIIRLWHNAWEQFIPFLDHDAEIRTVLCSTNAIESLNARHQRAIKAPDTSRPSRRRWRTSPPPGVSATRPSSG